MSPRPARPENILPGDHDAMNEAQRRGHYSAGCTHELCREANRDYGRQRAARLRAQAKGEQPAAPAPTPGETPSSAPTPKPAPPTATGETPALGASRRLQGLVYAGHSPVAIAHATQISVDNIWWLLFEQIPAIKDVNHRIIAREFQRLRMATPAPPAATAEARDATTARCRALAAAQGWVNPFGWDDIDHDAKPAHPNGQPQARPAQAAALVEVTDTAPALAAPELADAHPLAGTVLDASLIAPPAEHAAPAPAAAPSPRTIAAVAKLRALANAADEAADALQGVQPA